MLLNIMFADIEKTMSSLSRAASRLVGRGSSSPFRSISVSAAPRGDAVPTHTGMQFSEDDPRYVVFCYSVIYHGKLMHLNIFGFRKVLIPSKCEKSEQIFGC